MVTMPPEPPPAALRLKRDAQALAANWRTLDRLSGKARAGGAVKADAYGLGADFAVPVLRDAGCSDFFVAQMAEVPPLLSHVPPDQISVLHGPLTGEDVRFARAAGVKVVINTLHQAMLWRDSGGGRCDVMFDSGINRLGLTMADLSVPLVQSLDVDLLHSHLVSAEEDSPLNQLQCQRWNEARRIVPHKRASLANSAGIALGPDYHGDLTRPGLALYGGVPCAALGGEIAQVVTPEAALIQVRELQAGDTVGYNATFSAPAPMRVGVVSLGYADGYLRCWSGKGHFRHGDERLPVLGRVSMDMTIVDLTAAPMLREGDWVEAEYALADAAATSGLSQYELLTLLGRRFPR